MRHFTLTGLEPVYSIVDDFFQTEALGEGMDISDDFPSLPDLVDLDLAPLNNIDDFLDLGYDSDSDFNMDGLPVSAFLFCDEDQNGINCSDETPDLRCYEVMSPSESESEAPSLSFPEEPGVNCPTCEFHRSRGDSMCSLCYMRSTYALIYSPVTPPPEETAENITDSFMECMTQDEPLDLSVKRRRTSFL
ncbi:E1A [Bat mastadenovirus WIV13]|uniref:E1A n=1 Tax=Bat mastadenovirus WIV13 TaxID=1788435 RepID=A0A1B0UHX1_9ADEN|nr:E1A [Bat mastadenovirus WIV13]AMB43017.1 E1A [Bat mastadenovirus WIV13]